MTTTPTPNYEQLMRQAVRELRDLRAKVKKMEAATREPIAVIGLGCRFPGAENPAAYWQLLAAGRDAIRDVPPDHWPVDPASVTDPDPAAPGKTYVRSGGFLDHIDQFDPTFFGITPREAVSIDPQHRLLLEVTWETLETAALPPAHLAGTQTGIFIGILGNDYNDRWQKQPPSKIDAYLASGTSHSVAAGRLAYLLNTQGPALAIDTACSSSLVALHLAVNSLRRGECNLALAGGVQLILSPTYFITFSKANMLARDGRCKTFAATADGFGRGEGCGMVALKRLSDAQADGDTIWAVIRSSAVNQDGRTAGLTAPNGPAQQAVIRRALAEANLEPDAIGFIEAHGTGTPLGDPIELGALGAVFGPQRPAPLYIGSVKTNIGHLEAAAGIASFIKTVLALGKGAIPPNLHFQHPNPHIPWDDLPLQIPTSLTPWPADAQAAGVSSFGFSGTNAHLIVAPPPAAPTVAAKAERPGHLLTIRAKTEATLRTLAHAYAHHLTQTEDTLAQITFTANVGRAEWPWRLSLLAQQKGSVALALHSFATKEDVPGLAWGHAPTEPPQVAFLCPGQGAQYPGMGRSLYQTQPVFRKALDDCATLLADQLDRPLLALLFEADEATLSQTQYTQPALFALAYALAQVWLAWGITPAALVGHSVGEYVAACLAGIFSLADGLRLIAARGRLMQALPPGGAMIAIFAPPEVVQPALADREGVTLAALNAPEQVVISGARERVEAVAATLRADGYRTKPLTVSHAFHSPLIAPIVADFAEIARSISYQPPQRKIIANLSGRLAGPEMADAQYWLDHLLQPVQFARSLQTLAELGIAAFIELGPRATLLGMGSQTLPDPHYLWLSSLRSEREWPQLLDNLGRLYVRGSPVHWPAVEGDYPQRKVSLPTYPFQRKRYWLNEEKPFEPERPAWAELVYQLEWLKQDSGFGIQDSEGKGQAIEFQPQTANRKPQTCLVWGDEVGLGDAVTPLLTETGATVVRVLPGETLEQVTATTWRVPSTQAALTDLLATLPPLQSILYLATPLAGDWETLTGTDLAAAWQSVGQPLLALVGAVTNALSGERKPPRLYVVTQRSQVVLPRDTAPDFISAALWGLGKTIALEYPELRCTLLDLESGEGATVTAPLRAAIQQTGPDRWFAWRGGEGYVPRLRRWKAAAAQPLVVSGTGTYLISGGLGGLGLKVAESLVARGARHLALLTRRPVDDALEALVAPLRQRGASITLYQTDVTQREQVALTLQTIAATQPPLRGVIHAAGLTADGLLPNQTWPDFETVFAPKVVGAWHLHQLTEGQNLDFLLCFSSLAALSGSLGQANYVAANAGLDALAHYRRGRGEAALSLNWGAWAQVGMLARLSADEQAAWRRGGVEPLAPAVALDALFALGGSGVAQLAIAQIDWAVSRQNPRWGLGGPLTVDLLPSLKKQEEKEDEEKADARENVSQENINPVTSDTTPASISSLRQTILALPSHQRQAALYDHLTTELRALLGLTPDDPVDLTTGFFDLGMDSLMAVEFRNRLQTRLGVPLPATLTFKYSHLPTLAAHLTEVIFPAGEAATTPEGDVEAEMAAELAKLEALLGEA